VSDLPYFKFMVMDYLGGDIQACSFETQGVFINLCGRLWKRGGVLPDDDALISRLLRCPEQCYSNAKAELQEVGVLRSSKRGELQIKFITEQLKELSGSHKKRVEAGRKGGKAKALQHKTVASNAKAKLEQCSSILDLESESESESDIPPNPQGDDPDMLQVILDKWKELFPEKPQPRAWTHRKQFNTRWKSDHFRANWQIALERASESAACHEASWFHFEYVIKNDKNYEKMLNCWMKWKDDEAQQGKHSIDAQGAAEHAKVAAMMAPNPEPEDDLNYGDSDKKCPYPTHADDCDCNGAGGDR